MTTTQRHAFDALLSAWNTHYELRQSGAGLGALVDSRRQLDDARRHAACLRG